MIGVVIPAHDEESCISACLVSVLASARCLRLGGEPVLVVVALDACTDATRAIAQNLGVFTVSVTRRNVGHARATGAAYALRAGARWLAFTDADSVVAPGWLADQLSHASDAVCGTVEVLDWDSYSPAVRRRYEAAYMDADGHRHIHGANLGVDAAAYTRVGGFRALASDEDVMLVHDLQASGAAVCWSARPRVATSARRDSRAPKGFGALLKRMEQHCLQREGSP